MKKYFDLLQKCVLFSQIKEHDLSSLLSCLNAKVVFYNRNQPIISEGESAKFIGIVLSGSVQITQIDYYGNRSILASIEGSEVFAESFACAKVNSVPVNVVAREQSEVMLIDCDRIFNSCSNACGFHKQMLTNLIKNLAVKNLLFQQKIEITSKSSTREKLMAYLMMYAKKADSNRFIIPFNRQELADYLMVDRSGLSAEIGKLRNEGIIKSNKSEFELL